MRLNIFSIILIASLVFLFSCQDTGGKIEGFYRDDTGLGFLKVSKVEGKKYQVGNSQGHIEGILDGNAIRGTTALQDSFRFELMEDHAVYTILGVSSKYYTIPEAEFEKPIPGMLK